MHEMGVAMEILDIATASIPDDMGDARVTRVNLKVGSLSAIVAESLRFCFDIVTKDTRLAGAELNIEEIPVMAVCKDCNNQWQIKEPVFSCQKCSSGRVEVISGRELDIESIEISQEGE